MDMNCCSRGVYCALVRPLGPSLVPEGDNTPPDVVASSSPDLYPSDDFGPLDGTACTLVPVTSD